MIDKEVCSMAGKSRLHVLMPVLLSLLMLICMCAVAPVSHAAGLDAQKHTKAEIINYVRNHPWNMDDVKYTSEPSVTQPYSLGKISSESSTSALNYLNIYRYIAGVSEAPLDESAMEYAQAASLVMAANNELTHYISTKPSGMSDDMYNKAVKGAANSNIAGGGKSLCNTILRYMLEINGDENFGHRRQLLKPEYTGAGFGSVKSTSGSYYSATYVNAFMNENKVISYPGQMQPLEYFGTGYAWTVVVPQTIDPKTAVVTVTDKNKGTVWKFRNSSDDPDYQYMRIDDGCFIFSPDDIIYRDGDVYNVTITGIPETVSYDVNMFNIENIPVESVSLNNYVPSTIKGRSVTGSSGVVFTPENASNKNMIWTSSDDTIASVKNYGSSNYEITGHKEGSVTITGVPEGGSGMVQFEFTVNPEPTGVDVPDEIIVGKGQSYLLKATVLPEGCGASCSLYGIDTSIAAMKEVSLSQREITGVKTGTTQIKVSVWYRMSTDTTYDHLRKTIKVTVVDPVKATGITINGPDKVDVGQKAAFTADISPADATLKQVDWTTSSYSFRHLGNGVFQAEKNPGKYVVKAKTRDGSGLEASKEVEVYGKYETPEAPQAAELTSTSVTVKSKSISGYTYEYTIDGETWQTSKEFKDLKPDTEYSIRQRVAENPKAYRHASDVSEPLVVKTPACTHKWDEGVVKVPATCVSEGEKLFTCTICKETKTEVIERGAHQYGSWTITKAATCTEEGTEESTCSLCGVRTTRAIPASGHKWETVKGKVATHKKTGLTDGTICAVCGTVLEEQQVIPVNDFKVTAKKKSYKVRSGRKTVIKTGKLYRIKNKKGKLTYKKFRGNKKIKVAKNGKITVKKGLRKKKIYTVKVKVTSAATSMYAKCTRAVKIRIRVR